MPAGAFIPDGPALSRSAEREISDQDSGETPIEAGGFWIFRGLEQNPDTKSRWAKMAPEGKKVMQFLEGGRYVAVVVDER